MTVTAISHLTREPDWLMLRCQPPEQCASSIQQILKALEGSERFVYAVRGEALRLFDNRQLFALFTDPARNQPCSCTFRFLEVYFPDSARYWQESLVNRQRLYKAIPLEEAAKIPRANLRILEGVSESLQSRPEIHKAAQEQSEKQFARTMSQEHHQHVEESQVFKVKLSSSDYQAVIEALDECGRLMGIEDRGGELVALCIDFMLERQK
jgi:hypothetical protein